LENDGNRETPQLRGRGGESEKMKKVWFIYRKRVMKECDYEFMIMFRGKLEVSESVSEGRFVMW